MIGALLAFSEAGWFALAAGLVSLATLVITTIMGSRTLVRSADARRVAALETDLGRARQDVQQAGRKIDGLEERIAVCEADRLDLRKEIKRLSDRELDLMRRLLKLENSS